MLNIEIMEASNGRATLKMPFLIDLAQGAGLMHGGALVSLADTAVAMAIKTLIPPQSHFATIDLESKFLLPVKKGVVTATANVIAKDGRVLKGHATVRDDENRTVMEFTSTFKVAQDVEIGDIKSIIPHS
jgi:uncharacterized protein (TIGR00369 family)